jgi:hypothetical protein
MGEAHHLAVAKYFAMRERELWADFMKATAIVRIPY